MENQTTLYILVLSGLSDLPSLQLPLFLVFLLIPISKPPCNFFLGTLACLDMGYSSVTTPRMLFDFHTNNANYYTGCITQIFFLCFFAVSEVFLLAIMHWKACVLLVLGVFMLSVVNSLVHVLLLLRLSFCRLTPLESFFCDLPQLLLVSCSDTFINLLPILPLQYWLEESIPLIYSLRNEIMKNIIKKSLCRFIESHNECCTPVLLFLQVLAMQ
ncbi:hypothetical protein GDO86_017820 [Hymenochirus boettgeri]|uniref:G-protein coupled receptors family 1 profile domain-containing protein n=1 Tax=Hymenochirus boettgeri TaxID=247094 RepID=A0A8T2IPB5_9PIPI|nr:hypothetical protein GDO86_017820 [Hymenochirus boettgeri]